MKLHVSMKVSELETAVKFYSTLFGQEPVVVREGYAKWDVDNPAVNFVVESGHDSLGFDHIGIQASDEDELVNLAERMKDTGGPFLDVQQTNCCFAKMEKAWVRGPSNEPWEGFLTHSHDNEEYGEDRDTRLPLYS